MQKIHLNQEEAELLERAKAAQLNAYAPYSDFSVGAAIRSGNGRVFIGCNAENISYPLGSCAEAGAIAAMVAAGDRHILSIAVIGSGATPLAPCGGCRQRIAEFASADTAVIMASENGLITRSLLSELLPSAFDETQMNQRS